MSDTIKILLTRGLFAVIDQADAAKVSIHHWCAHRRGRTHYAATNIKSADGKRITLHMHRLLVDAAPDEKVDHIDGDGLNNSRSNLRRASHSENMRNSRRRKDNSTGFKGVSPGRHGRFQAKIQVNRKTMWLGE